MKIRTLLRNLCPLIVSFYLPTLRGEEFILPKAGTISLTVPATWSIVGQAKGGNGYYLSAKPKSAVAAVVQITLMDTPPEHPVVFADLPGELQSMVQPYLADSVEGKFAPHEIFLKQGKGWYNEITDASLVGKPPVPDNFKIMRNAVLGLDDHLMGIATMQFDNPSANEVTEMLAMVSSLRFTRSATPTAAKPSGVLGDFVFTVPESHLRLKIPASGLVQDTERIGGSTDSPRYFKLTRHSPDLILSGWLEPAHRYDGLQKLWAGETVAWGKNGLPRAENVEFFKAGDWEIVGYEIAVPNGSSTHLRAELARAGTWVDLHLSSTSTQSATVSRKLLLTFLKTIEVTEK